MSRASGAMHRPLRPASAGRRRAAAVVLAIVVLLGAAVISTNLAGSGSEPSDATGTGQLAAPATTISLVPATSYSQPAAPGTTPTASSTVSTTYDTLALGVTMFATWRDWATFDQLLATAVRSGTHWLRIDMGWCSLEEQGPGVISAWYQSRLDTIVSRATGAGLEVLMMVGCAPAWAGGSTYHNYPSDPAQYERIMTYLSRRYRTTVTNWEIWNEPDCIGGCGNGSAASYVPILQAGFRGVRAGNPAATVVSGGISGNDVTWLKQMYAAGGGGYFDALATHPYIDPTTAGPSLSANGNIYRITAVTQVHDLMVAEGDGAKPIWFTELGWSTPTGGDRAGVDEQKQAAYLDEAVKMIADRYPYVTHAFWYMLRDRDDSTPYENAFGLLRLDGSAKPSFNAFTLANAELAAR